MTSGSGNDMLIPGGGGDGIERMVQERRAYLIHWGSSVMSSPGVTRSVSAWRAVMEISPSRSIPPPLESESESESESYNVSA